MRICLCSPLECAPFGGNCSGSQPPPKGGAAGYPIFLLLHLEDGRRGRSQKGTIDGGGGGGGGASRCPSQTGRGCSLTTGGNLDTAPPDLSTLVFPLPPPQEGAIWSAPLFCILKNRFWDDGQKPVSALCASVFHGPNSVNRKDRGNHRVSTQFFAGLPQASFYGF